MANNDLLVVIPGITGSTLRHEGRVIWSCRPGDVLKSLVQLQANIDKLKLPDGIGDDSPRDGIEPAALMPSLHGIPGLWTPIRGYEPLANRLRTVCARAQRGSDSINPELNPVYFPYDWRLSNRYTARRLKVFVESALERWRTSSPANRDALVTFVCHSMGGLVARWYVSMEGGASVTRKLITLGTPHRGTVRALEVLTSGPAPRLGRFGRSLHEVAATFPSLHQLLPSYACVDDGPGMKNMVDAQGLPLSTSEVADAASFYRDLELSEDTDPECDKRRHVITGTGQATLASASLTAGQYSFSELLQGRAHGGDGTVSAVSLPKGVALDDNTVRRVADKHGSLQCNSAVLDEIESVVTSDPIVIKSSQSADLSVAAPELVDAHQLFTIAIGSPERRTVLTTLCDEHGRTVTRSTTVIRGDEAICTFGPLAPGGYTLESRDLASTQPGVISPFIVWPTEL